jgi:Zn ribbon nucleic-acid-binding protein
MAEPKPKRTKGTCPACGKKGLGNTYHGQGVGPYRQCVYCGHMEPQGVRAAQPIRTKWMDPDFRRDPKTPHFCVMCQRDLMPGQPHRAVRWELDKLEAIHPADWERAATEIPAQRAPQIGERTIEHGLLGMDCARKLGLEWSVPA